MLNQDINVYSHSYANKTSWFEELLLIVLDGRVLLRAS